MRKTFLLLFAAFCALSTVFAQTKGNPASLKGVIVNEHSKQPIADAKVFLANQNMTTTTNAQGVFSLVFLDPINEEVVISASEYVTQVKLVKLLAGQTVDLGEIVMKSDVASEVKQEIVLQLSENELADDEGRSQNMSSSLSKRGDVFSSHTSYAFSPMRFRVRGYGQEHEITYINGVNFNSQERGQFNYSMIGGLNDATRNKDVTNGIEANPVSFGGITTTTNILTTASRFAAGWKVGLSGTNRNYKGRVYATYATGVMENGWAFAGSLAFRYSPYIDTKIPAIGEGIFYHSGAYYFSAEKKFNEHHNLAITTFGAPTQRAQSAAVTQETYDLYGSIYYNPYWGYQYDDNGVGHVRNSRIVKSFDPTAIINYEWKINEDHVLKFNEGFHYSLYSNSALTFYNAPDPRPDYYRNLPSFLFDNQVDENGNFIFEDMNGVSLGGVQEYNGVQFGPSVDYEAYKALTDQWTSRDPQATQINWNNLYNANYANNINNPDATAKYMIERRHNDIWENMFNVHYTGQLTPHLKMTAALETKYSQGRHYKTVDDLLGANQWIDLDPFADRDIAELAQNIGMTQADIENVRQNDLNNPDKAVKKGDVFGYNYDINMFTTSLYAQNEWKFNQVEFYYALKGTFNTFNRVGRMDNGRAEYLRTIYERAGYAEYGALYSSYGKGRSHYFIDPSFKAGVTYKIDGRNALKVNALAESRAPLARNAYVSPRIHDRTIEGLRSSRILSYDLTYEFNYGVVRGRVTGFRTHFENGTELNGYYDDGFRTFVNQAMTGVSSIHQGGEAAVAVKMGTYFTLSAVASITDNHYTKDAYSVTSAENGMALDAYVDNAGNTQPLYELRDSVLIKGLKVANGPQLAASLKLSFFHPKMWFADVTVSYFDWNYLDFAPSRRMQGLFTGQRADGSIVNGWYNVEKDENGNTMMDRNGHPVVAYPHSVLSAQESLVSTQWYNRFLVDLSVGKLIYLPNRQSLSINLSVSNLLNNTDMKTGGYQQGRLPRSTKQGSGFNGSQTIQESRIANNVWKYPAKYYYAWGTNFFLNLTYKF